MIWSRQAFAVVAKALPQTPHPVLECLKFKFQTLSQFQLSTNANPKREQVRSQTPSWKNQCGFLPPDFNLAPA